MTDERVRVCPECGSMRVRSNSGGHCSRGHRARYQCRNCQSHFDVSAWGEPESRAGLINNPHTLAARLAAADPDDVGRGGRHA